MTFNLCSRIWKINITGNEQISREQIIKALESQDIYCGLKISKLNGEAVENYLMNEFDRLAWTSVDVSGTQINISIKEKKYNSNNELDKEIYSKSKSDIIASKNAQISSIITRSGMPLVIKGDEVKKGDILVSCACPIVDDSGIITDYLYKEADADIWGYTNYTFSIEVPQKEQIRELSGNDKSFYTFRLGNFIFNPKLLYSGYSDRDILSEGHQLKLFKDYYLPIIIYKNTIYETRIQNVTHSKEDALRISKEQLEDKVESLEKNGVLIISKNGIIDKIGNKYYYKGNIKTCEKIGVKK